MTNHGDDCYFFYYSTCTKGDSCPFRHCEAAMGNETVCNLWQEGRCFRTVCKFRHMEIKKNRKEIACYWENQPAGCQKPHCAFYHEKPRFIDGVYVPPNKGLTKNEDPPHEEPAPPPAPLPTAANPQIRGVIKAETQETVPSPTHPPVVINPADDDEDEDDQFSEEGEDGKVGPDGTRLVSPRKLAGCPNSNESLNFGVSTLEEIRLRKALKASMKRAGYPVQSADSSLLRSNGEKENIRSLVRPALLQATDDPLISEETGRPRGSVAERLGKKIFNNDTHTGGHPPLKRSLAERLGRVVDEEDAVQAPQKGVKSVRERLGLSADPVAPAQPALPIVETNMESKKTPEQIRIKTLEEIRQEKATKSQSQKDSPAVVLPPAPTATKSSSSKAATGSKRAITVKSASIVQVKTFSEILHARKKKQEGGQEKQDKPSSPNKTKQKGPDEAQGQSDAAAPSRVASPGAEVRVKTLEEIRREKAAKIQVQQTQEPEDSKSPAPGFEEATRKKPRLLRINKPAPVAGSATQKTAEVTEKPVKAANCDAEASPASSNGVKVKTFEEIMREKRLRKQEVDEQASSTSQSDGAALKTKVPTGARVTPAATSPSSTTLASDTTSPTQKAPVRKLVSFKPKAASLVHGNSTATTAVTSTSPMQGSPPRQAETDSPLHGSRDSTAKRKRSAPAPAPAKQARGAASQDPSGEETPIDKTPNNSQEKSPGQTAETKVRPKLNVKPSVMKPAAQVKPGQKRKAAERSAVAAVKPLNSTSTVPEEPLQEPPCKQREIFSSSNAEAQLCPAVPRSPTTLLGSEPSTSPLREELQTVPVFQQNPVQAPPALSTANTAAREACTVPQSPVTKPPAQSKSRRPSLAASRVPSASSTAASLASAVDDFEELMNEFTDDHIEEDVDPGMGEDDLLQELSDMIDS